MSAQDDERTGPGSPGVDAAKAAAIETTITAASVTTTIPAAYEAAAFAAAIETAWAEGEPGWERLARAWATPRRAAPTAPADADASAAEGIASIPEALPGDTPSAVPCWWEGPPWDGRIADEVFRAIVALYVAAYGTYTPDLPSREPGLLRAWLREHADDAPPRVAA
jgi:hypothetical protein